MHKIPLRMDILSRSSFPKEELIRLVKVDNKLVIDIENKLPGRGYYIKKDKSTLAKAKKKDALKRIGADASIYEELEKLC